MGLLGDPLEPARQVLADLDESRRNADGTLAKDLAERLHEAWQSDAECVAVSVDDTLSVRIVRDAITRFNRSHARYPVEARMDWDSLQLVAVRNL